MSARLTEGMVLAPESVFEEQDVLRHIRKWRWLNLKVGNIQVLQINWVVWALATFILIGFVIASAVAPDDMGRIFRSEGQPWVTQNFTWLYILTQDVWCIFLFYLCFTKYGNLKLGKDNELPRYNDLTWFAMIFCCGIAVGFYLFGPGEPLYYYRQPTYWKSWAYDYATRKTSIGDDDQRATYSIFITLFHWGIHGWIPYILMAINAAVVGHRWGLPITIRATMYPLIGDHVYSFMGDLIDAISMACTTFGVCTSLGLGAMQLVSALVFMEKEFSADGTSSIDANDTGLYIGMIWGITALATFSVATGLNRGLKYLSLLAMSLCLIVLFFVLLADNTAYLMNVLVQSIGYYVQYIIQVGFDCEAFQQLTYEFDTSSSNLLWGSTPDDLAARLNTAMGDLSLTSGDCGMQANPCSMGKIAASFFVSGAVGAAGLAGLERGGSSADFSAGADVFAAYPSATAIPCGSGWNTTHADAAVQTAMGLSLSSDEAITFSYPSCPTTAFDAVGQWGTCDSHSYSCTKFQAHGETTNRYFMDWWTIFYWGWWVSWGPFVGIFIATISRGRTIRQVILGGFFLPMLFSFCWFCVMGGLAIKMQRVAEYALDVKPDWEHGTVRCDPHYDGSGNPTSDEAIALDSLGYSMLACKPFVTQIYDLMRPYQNFAPFLYIIMWIGLFWYFITSSDSGSYVDDLLSASGLSNPPVLQKIYWGITEGAVASALVGSAADGNFSNVMKALRSVSICAGFPLTILLCLMVPATWRAIKYEFGEQDIIKSKKFNTQLLDFVELYRPKYNRASPYHGKASVQLTKLVIALFAPGVAVFASLSKIPNHGTSKFVIPVLTQLLWLAWLILHCVDAPSTIRDAHALAWTAYIFMICSIGYCRYCLRQQHNIWGSLFEDMWVSFVMYPFVAAQSQMMAEDPTGAPDYFEDLTAVLAEQQAAAKETVIAEPAKVETSVA
jgi:choline-glycine betaine transporter